MLRHIMVLYFVLAIAIACNRRKDKKKNKNKEEKNEYLTENEEVILAVDVILREAAQSCSKNDCTEEQLQFPYEQVKDSVVENCPDDSYNICLEWGSYEMINLLDKFPQIRKEIDGRSLHHLFSKNATNNATLSKHQSKINRTRVLKELWNITSQL